MSQSMTMQNVNSQESSVPNPSSNKRKVNKFTREDDDIIIAFYNGKYKDKDQKWLSNKIGHSIRSIKERYKFYLSNRNMPWTEEELQLLWNCVQMYGNNWTTIKNRHFSTRSPLVIRDTYNSIGKPKFMKKYPCFTIPTLPNLTTEDLSSDMSLIECLLESYD